MANSVLTREKSASYILETTKKGSRFQIHPDGTHTHHLTQIPTHRWISSINDAVDGFFNRMSTSASRFHLWAKDRPLPEETLKEERKLIDNILGRDSSTGVSLVDTWGRCQTIIGKGNYGTVRLIASQDPCIPNTRLYAVKEFRKRRSESIQSYVRRLTPEYVTALHLHHPHIVQVFDLLPLNDKSLLYCQVMEYCDGCDLFHQISQMPSGLVAEEANCYFRQLMSGVAYLHTMGVTHRDIKPENLLFTSKGCLKITDFGSSFCFRSKENARWVEYSRGLVGSEPYMAPEIFVEEEYDPRPIDIWSCAIVYMVMRTGSYIWYVAKKEDDERYSRYLRFRAMVDDAESRISVSSVRSLSEESQCSATGREDAKARERLRRRAKLGRWDVLESLEDGPKGLIYHMLTTDPRKRMTSNQVLEDSWFESIECCQ
ncbi:kinase-like domain-containing protein [Phycomyces nitens]|nr:kinase-like domain-containing protein [Phycomyces nitens]